MQSRLFQTAKNRHFKPEEPAEEEKEQAVHYPQKLFASNNPHTQLSNPLLQLVVDGDEYAAKKMAASNSELLLQKGTARDYSDRIIRNVTPYQAALCMQDIEMCKMLQNYLSARNRKSQYDEIFPNGSNAYFSSQEPFDFRVLVCAISESSAADIKAALDKQQNDTRICQALNQFRNAFDEQSHSEMVFNPQHLLKAFQIYNEQLNNWDWDKKTLFWRQVIGYVQRYLPACFAQATAQGIYYITEESEALCRSCAFRFGDGYMFPLSQLASCSGLGFDYACRSSTHPRGAAASSGGDAQVYEKLCRAKTSYLGELRVKPQHADLGELRVKPQHPDTSCCMTF